MCTPTDDIAAALASQQTSPWLRDALHSAMQRGDLLSAANDAAELARLLTGEVEAMIFLDQWRAPGADSKAAGSR